MHNLSSEEFSFLLEQNSFADIALFFKDGSLIFDLSYDTLKEIGIKLVGPRQKVYHFLKMIKLCCTKSLFNQGSDLKHLEVVQENVDKAKTLQFFDECENEYNVTIKDYSSYESIISSVKESLRTENHTCLHIIPFQLTFNSLHSQGRQLTEKQVLYILNRFDNINKKFCNYKFYAFTEKKVPKLTKHHFYENRPPTEYISLNLNQYFPNVRKSSKLNRSAFVLKIDTKLDESLPGDDEVSTATSMSPAKTDKWVQGSLIGQGSFGSVVLGLNTRTAELSAIKQVELPTLSNEERKIQMLKSFEHEVSLLQELNHSNIVRYLDCQITEEKFLIYLEYVPGGSVRQMYKSYGAFEEPLIRNFTRQILNGLCYLHEKKIIHRDIKGANILIDNRGRAKISDFGLSKRIENQVLMASRQSGMQGSVHFMSPEVVRHSEYITAKADIWSLGCTIIEMLTAELPWGNTNSIQVMFKIGHGDHPVLPDNLSDYLKDFLSQCFKFKPEERPNADVLLKHPFLEDGILVCTCTHK
ncbi:Protein kinase, catalytic domain-containing protein [Rozella allomycis CSF55]|uniref:Protein kinase, catalytic domain-containing protein n=1 Tax=Rozella allomycis (strain CSF55) TaxID=988480 RepID=A0A075APW5_ROZAC|nr:Protein kinase, catalytic domain-containing protein [Rozella allomycis CSF55]|eukprot:EPZ32143.1 Protein kinase, catalytic domain-containing protein [Rozella allomycis CSF55]